MNKEILQKAADIIALHTVHSHQSDKILVCALGQIDLDGTPTVAAITAAQAEGLRQIDFSSGLSSNKAKRLAKSNKASVCFLSESYNISLAGTLEIVTDPAVKKATWYDALSQHFSGPDDPDFCVLRFTAERYNLLIDWQECRGVIE
jgi:general stress protein 26